MPVISPGAGTVRVGVDNDGQVTKLHSSVRDVEELSPKARSRPPHPSAANGKLARAPAGPAAADDVDAVLAPAVGARMRELMGKGGTIVGVATVPGTAEIGYDFSGDAAELVARKGIEVDFGGGFRKRYWVQTTLFG